jgi:hypothetical protein
MDFFQQIILDGVFVENDNQKTVVVMGAGASLSQATHFRPKKSRKHPPLDGNFFSKCESLKKGKKDVVDTDSLWNSFKRELEVVGGFPSTFGNINYSMEQFFADVYFEAFGNKSKEAFAIYKKLLRLYVGVISETTDWIVNNNKRGILEKILSSLASSSENLEVITFNHDLILESVAEKISKNRGWSLSDLYGQNEFEHLVPLDDVPMFQKGDGASSKEPPFHLLKLHGSLNWVVRTQQEEPSISALFPDEGKKLFLFNKKSFYKGEYFQSQENKGRKNWPLWPLIVPPIYDKQKIIGQGLIDKVWEKAFSEVSSANKLVFIGYSFPDADVWATQMFRRALWQNDNINSLELVNPDSGVVTKLQNKFGLGFCHWYADLGLYKAKL